MLHARVDADVLAVRYNREVQRRVNELDAVTRSVLGKAVGRRLDAGEVEEAITEGDWKRLVFGLSRVTAFWRAERRPDDGKLAQLFDDADTRTTTAARREVARAVRGRHLRDFLLGVPAEDPVALRKDFVSANVDLITSIDARYFDDVRRRVEQAHRDGRGWGWLQRELVERHQVSRSRGQLIARDQLGKLTSQLTQVRNLELGVESYQWLTSHDERVRRSHERLSGLIFRWDQPPEVGHPGMDFQCRCTSRPVMDEEHRAMLVSLAEERARRTSRRLTTSPIITGEIVPIPSRRISATRVAEFRGEFRQVA